MGSCTGTSSLMSPSDASPRKKAAAYYKKSAREIVAIMPQVGHWWQKLFELVSSGPTPSAMLGTSWTTAKAASFMPTNPANQLRAEDNPPSLAICNMGIRYDKTTPNGQARLHP